MFYLKYRPQIIQHIDNSKIREKLIATLQKDPLPHAFLFTGTKGAGKTSTARIIAKAINCERNSFGSKEFNNIEPCNECINCQAITNGTALDVIEMDAASNRKIDEMRELIDKVKFAPVYTRYKVYIIDEVHMLTNEPFNALLKTLEEPPSSTIFILATTELEKLPKTIVSRCIHFSFGKAETNEIISMLKRVAKGENLQIDESALTFIAQHADNSFRDATKLLEEAQTANKLDVQGIQTILNISPNSSQIVTYLEQKNLE